MPTEFTIKRRVQFSETDMAGIMHFANYFRLMEEVEHAFLRLRRELIEPFRCGLCRSEAGRERENSGSHQGEGGFGHAVSFHKG